MWWVYPALFDFVFVSVIFLFKGWVFKVFRSLSGMSEAQVISLRPRLPPVTQKNSFQYERPKKSWLTCFRRMTGRKTDRQAGSKNRSLKEYISCRNKQWWLGESKRFSLKTAFCNFVMSEEGLSFLSFFLFHVHFSQLITLLSLELQRGPEKRSLKLRWDGLWFLNPQVYVL